jgi:hypothetical protein
MVYQKQQLRHHERTTTAKNMGILKYHITSLISYEGGWPLAFFKINKSTLLSRFSHLYGHNMSPSALKIHLKSVLFHKCCQYLCVSVPRCVHDTFPHFWRIPTLIYVSLLWLGLIQASVEYFKILWEYLQCIEKIKVCWKSTLIYISSASRINTLSLHCPGEWIALLEIALLEISRVHIMGLLFRSFMGFRCTFNFSAPYYF